MDFYKYNFNKYFKIFNKFSISFIAISILLLLFKGLNFGVDFKGGTLIELRATNDQVTISQIRQSFSNMNLGDVSIKKFGKNNDFLIKIEAVEEDSEPGTITIKRDFIGEIKNMLTKDIGKTFEFRRVEKVGPKVSNELLKNGLIAIAASLAAMLFYIWVRFEWQFSIGAIIALFHDVILTLGIFSLFNLEINLSIVAAVLTIVGYSMNDTVVIFDRVRENLKKYSDVKIFDLTNKSINETLSRTIITSVTTLLALISIYIFGGDILRGFSLAMILGVIFGTYSSIYIANPILILLNVSQKTILKEDKN
tara:strand:+ start:1843 stop:2769 length:927 start_codon:yes stop_codon:yes gene_type:complete